MLNRPSRYFNAPPVGQSYGLQFNSGMQANEKSQKKTEKQETEPVSVLLTIETWYVIC